MRIAVLAPTAWRVPPRHYGPWEQFASLLTEGLVAHGVDVTLFATADSRSAATLVSVMAHGYEEDPDVDVKVWEHLHISEVFERAGQFDLIHNSFDFVPLTYSALVDTPVLTTIHGFSNESILPVYQKYNGRTHYVAISEADRHRSLDYLATIHHGIDTERFALHPDAGEYLLFFGRIHPDKGTAAAISVARTAGIPLIIAGFIQDQAYFDAEVAPHLDGNMVRYVGPVGPRERAEVLGKAHAHRVRARLDVRTDQGRGQRRAGTRRRRGRRGCRNRRPPRPGGHQERRGQPIRGRPDDRAVSGCVPTDSPW